VKEYEFLVCRENFTFYLLITAILFVFLNKDYHTTGHHSPPADDIQNFYLLGSSEVDGTTTIRFKRKLQTGDNQDIDFKVSCCSDLFSFSFLPNSSFFLPAFFLACLLSFLFSFFITFLLVLPPPRFSIFLAHTFGLRPPTPAF